MNTQTNIHGAKLVEPQGRRFQVDGNFVKYAGWSFAYRVRSSAGLQIFDLRFNGEELHMRSHCKKPSPFTPGDSPAAMQPNTLTPDGRWALRISSCHLGSTVQKLLIL